MDINTYMSMAKLSKRIDSIQSGAAAYGTLEINSAGDLILTQEDSAAENVTFAINDNGELEVTTNE